MYSIWENLTDKERVAVFELHYSTKEYNNQNFVYGYQFAGAIIKTDSKYSNSINK